MDVSAYFERIGYSGPRTPDRATLDALMRAHVAAIPFENLDVQLGRPVSLDAQAIFAKLVGRRRGGWCFEQNGLFGRVLVELGFEVTRLGGGVLRSVNGDGALGNHLALMVMLEGRPWLADVGFGGSLAAPLPLAAGEHAHAPYTLALALQGDGYWRFTEWVDPSKPFSFDFRAAPADEARFAEKCGYLQTSGDSPFVQNLVVQRRIGDRHLSLRGRVLVETSAAGEIRATIDSAHALVATLHERFGLDVPEAAGLWERIGARHEALFASEGAASA